MADRFLAAHLVRSHRRATVLLALGLGCAAAIPIAAWSAARRTDKAFSDFRRATLQDLGGVRGAIFCPTPEEGCGVYDPVAEEHTVAAWPEVLVAARIAPVIGSVKTTGEARAHRVIGEAYFDRFTTLDGALITQSGRARLVAGRLPRDDADDEILVNEPFLSARHAALGQTIELGLYSQAEFAAAGEAALPPSRGWRAVRIVGVTRMPRDLQAGSTNGGMYSDPSNVMLGPGVLATVGDDIAAYAIGLYVIPKSQSTDVAALLANRVPTPAQIVDLGGDESDQLDAVQRSVHLQANSARAIALISAIAVLTFGGQVMVRQLRRELAMRATLTALGLTRAELRRVVMLRCAPIAALAVVTCPLVAYLASPVGPVGISRRAERHLGFRADPITLSLGSAVLVAALVAAAAASMRAAGRRTPLPLRGPPLRFVCHRLRASGWPSCAESRVSDEQRSSAVVLPLVRSSLPSCSPHPSDRSSNTRRGTASPEMHKSATSGPLSKQRPD